MITRFSLLHWLYTQNGLNLFCGDNIKYAGEKRNHRNFSFRQHYFYTFVVSEVKENRNNRM